MSNNHYCAICTYIYNGGDDVAINPIFNVKKEEAFAHINEFINYYLPEEDKVQLDPDDPFDYLEHDWNEGNITYKVVVQLYNLDSE